LKIQGGSIDKITVPTLHQQSARHIFFKDMPSIQLGEVFANLPEMKTFRVDNVDDFTQE